MLVEHILTRAAVGGLRSVRLKLITENRSSIKLYEALGFVPYGREPAAYRLGEREWDLLLRTRDCGFERTSGPREEKRSPNRFEESFPCEVLGATVDSRGRSHRHKN